MNKTQNANANLALCLCNDSNSSLIQVNIVSIMATELPMPNVNNMKKNNIDHNCGRNFILLNPSG